MTTLGYEARRSPDRGRVMTDCTSANARSPAVPDRLGMKGILHVPFEYLTGPLRRDAGTGLLVHTDPKRRQSPREQFFIPRVRDALVRFVGDLERAGLRLAAILTYGSHVPRCMRGTSKPSRHAAAAAIDIRGVRWADPRAVGSRVPELIMHRENNKDPEQRLLLLRLGAAARLHFDLVLDDHFNEAHQDHLHCDMQEPAGRRYGPALFEPAQEMAGLVLGRAVAISGKYRDLQPLLAEISGLSHQSIRWTAKRNPEMDRAFDLLFERVLLGQLANRSLISPPPGGKSSGTKKGADERLRWAQQLLNALEGEKLGTDGLMGKYTRGALIRFQERQGLRKSGQLDQATELALVQRFLEERAQQSMFAQKGVADPRTTEELRRFEASAGIAPDGVLDDATRAAMVQALRVVSPAPAPSKTPVSGKVERHKNGWKAYGGGRIEDVLRRLRTTHGLQVTDQEVDLFRRIGAVESGGLINAINSWDSAYMSVGFMQWTVIAGELQEWIKRAPAAFRRHGVELEGRYRFHRWKKWNEQPAIRGAPRLEDLRKKEWAERFYAAGLEPEAIAAEVQLAREELAAFERKVAKLAGATAHAHFSNPLVRALLFELNNNRPAYVKYVVPAVAKGSAGRSDLTLDGFLSLMTNRIADVYAAREKDREKGLRLSRKIIRA